MRYFVFIIVFFSVFHFGCKSEAAQRAQAEARMNAEVEKRIVEYTAVLKENCRKRTLEQAIIVADSLIIQAARLSGDTLFKPLRPDKPETQLLIDTTPVKPFLKNPKDTILKKSKQ